MWHLDLYKPIKTQGLCALGELLMSIRSSGLALALVVAFGALVNEARAEVMTVSAALEYDFAHIDRMPN